MNAEVRTTCPYCGVGCGVLASVSPAGKVEVRGDPAHPANRGRLCSKGAALGDTLGLQGRLLYPQIRGQRVSWEVALRYVGQRFTEVVRDHGPDALAFYVSGQLLTEDYYVANKLMKGFIGSANIDTNSRLCMASAVAGHKRAFGADIVPGCYEDFELARLIVLAGSNSAWCHPVLHQRILETKDRRPDLKIVVIDPRRTATAQVADLHLPIRPGTDVTLFNGLLTYLHEAGWMDQAFVAAHTEGVEDALALARTSAPDAEVVARACGLAPRQVQEFYELFAESRQVITAFSQGVNQSTAGTDKVNSLINCHLLTGRIGHPGMGPFSLTGQPNAMGGREVGGMATLLASHMDLGNESHRELVQRFWNSPRMASRPGLKAVELFEAVHQGRIKALWIMATNPIVSLPNADRAREALQRCELVVVSDCIAQTDTTALAHVLLPASAWGEKEGTVTNSERCISRQRAFLPPPGEARPDWWIVCEVAKRMGFNKGFDRATAHEIFDEHAQLSGFENASSRVFDISGLSGMSRAQYEELAPIQWPVRGDPPSGTQRLLGQGSFWTANGRARFIAVAATAPALATTDEFPLVLNTGRIRDQWHTMTRTGRAGRLTEHESEPYIDLHAQDALLTGVCEGQLARLTTAYGSMVARCRFSGEMARGCVFVPIHWSDTYASDARVGATVNPHVDALSGEPEFKYTPARVEPFHVQWYAVLMTREPSMTPEVTWWVRVQAGPAHRQELAGREDPADWSSWSRTVMNAPVGADYLEYHDAAAGVYRAAYLQSDRLHGCLYVSRRPELPSRSWLLSFFAKDVLPVTDRTSLLAGRPALGTADPGSLVCSCFGVHRQTIQQAIETYRLRSTREVAERVRAGSNCGSCVPEIRALLAREGSVQ